MKLERAQNLAEAVIKRLENCWVIAAYGGSIRRERPEVKDIELIFVLATGGEDYSDLNEELKLLALNGKIEILKNGEKYKQFWLTRKIGSKIIKVDLFIVTPPASFGVIHTIRTGSAAFSKWLVNCRKDKGFLFRKGALYREGKLIKTPSEHEVFQALQLKFVKAPKREASILNFNSLKNDWNNELDLDWMTDGLTNDTNKY